MSLFELCDRVGAPHLSSLRAASRAWLSGSTGVLRRPGVEAGAVGIVRGGLVNATDAPLLRALILGGTLEFAPRVVAGEGSRRGFAAVLAAVAGDLVRRAPASEGVVEVDLYVPRARLLELGLSDEADATERLARGAAQVLEVLGLARVRGRRPGGMAPADPTLTEELFPDSGDDLDLGWLEDQAEEDSYLAVGIATAEDLLRRRQWEMAERLLRSLRDRRIDDGMVLILLATAMVADRQNVREERIEEAHKWISLATQLGGQDGDHERRLDAARRSLADAESALTSRRLAHPDVAWAKEA